MLSLPANSNLRAQCLGLANHRYAGAITQSQFKLSSWMALLTRLRRHSNPAGVVRA